MSNHGFDLPPNTRNFNKDELEREEEATDLVQ